MPFMNLLKCDLCEFYIEFIFGESKIEEAVIAH